MPMRTPNVRTEIIEVTLEDGIDSDENATTAASFDHANVFDLYTSARRPSSRKKNHNGNHVDIPCTFRRESASSVDMNDETRARNEPTEPQLTQTENFMLGYESTFARKRDNIGTNSTDEYCCTSVKRKLCNTITMRIFTTFKDATQHQKLLVFLIVFLFVVVLVMLSYIIKLPTDQPDSQGSLPPPPSRPCRLPTSSPTMAIAPPKGSCGTVYKDPSKQPLGGGNGYSRNLITRNSLDSDRTFELGDYDPTLYGFYDVRKDIEEWRSANFNNTLDESNSTTTTILVKQDDEQPIMMIVKNLVGLGGAIQAAKDGDIIWIEEWATINMLEAVQGSPLPNFDGATVHKSITIASGRGQRSEGALLYIDDEYTTWTRMLRVTASNSRITGIRFRGPHPRLDHGNSSGWVTGLIVGGSSSSSAAKDIVVDNCEFSGFSQAGVSFTHVSNGKALNSYFHENRRETPTRKGGYGVSIHGGSSVVIQGSYFDMNRHDISGTGDALQQYSAQYNVIGSNGIAGSFDVHGQCEEGSAEMSIKCSNVGGSDRAGQALIVNHNLFLPRTASPGQPSVIVRGTPRSLDGERERYYSESGATVQFNCFAETAESLPVQRVVPHCHTSDCNSTFLPMPFEDASLHDAFYVSYNEFNAMPHNHLRWQSKSSNSSFVPSAIVGRPSFEADRNIWPGQYDVDGDGKDDLVTTFEHDGIEKAWYSLSGQREWEVLHLVNHEEIKESKFSDFDGDGITDAVRIDENFNIVVSYGMTQPWTVLNPLCNASDSFPNMTVLEAGVFTRDSYASVFRATTVSGDPPGKWQICSRQTDGWKDIQTSNYDISSLTFADLNGDGVLDVATSTRDARWLAVFSKSSGERTGWKEVIRDAEVPISEVKWAKHGQGKAFGLYEYKDNIFRVDVEHRNEDSAILVATKLDEFLTKELSYHGKPLKEVYLADYDGDGITDLAIHHV